MKLENTLNYVCHEREGCGVCYPHLKDVVYSWYKDWDQAKGDGDELSLWKDFSNAFVDHFFLQGLREAKEEKFVNLK